jgi:hypothetical protein
MNTKPMVETLAEAIEKSLEELFNVAKRQKGKKTG